MKIELTKLQNLSIRGRVALGLRCVELARIHYKEENIIVNEIIEFFWTFTLDNKLDEWHEKAYEISPYCMLDPDDDPESEFKTITIEKAKVIREAYLKISPVILELLDEVVRIGTGNTYSAIIGYSEDTLNPLIRIIEIMEANNIEMPDISTFSKSSFKEDGGWGEIHPRAFFVN